MIKCVILASDFGVKKVLGSTLIDKFILDHSFIDKFYVLIDKNKLIEYKENIVSDVCFVYYDEVEDLHKYIGVNDTIIVVKDSVVFKDKISKESLKEEYKCKDYLYVFYAKNLFSKKRFKEIKKDIYEGSFYNIKQTLIKERNKRFIDDGVDIIDINSTFIDYDCEIGEGSVIYPNTFIEDNTRICSKCTIKGNIKKSIIKDNVTIKDSYVENSIIDDGVSVGPYSYIHDDCLIKSGSIIGSYVELKKCIIGCYTKVKHQSVLLDCIIGDNVNVGAGVITANYDGEMKHISKIGNKSFIGCNSVIISPITIGKNCFVAADTTVVKDIDDNEFAISRVNQVNKVKRKLNI